MNLGMIAPCLGQKGVERVAALGLDFIEYDINYEETPEHDHWQEFSAQAESLRGWTEAAGIGVGAVGRWGGNKVLADGSANPAELEADTALIRAAAAVGAPVYMTGCNYIEGLSLYRNYTAAIGYFERLLELGRENGVKIAAYNCRWNNYLHSDPAWDVVLGHLPELGIKFDPSHSRYAQGEDYLAETKKWGSRFYHVHIKGSLLIDGERFDDPPAGLDQTDWGSFLACLYASGYQGGLSIEPHSATWRGALGDAGLRYTIDYIRKLLFPQE